MEKGKEKMAQSQGKPTAKHNAGSVFPLFSFPFSLFLVLLLAALLTPGAYTQSPAKKLAPRADERWVESTLKKMTLDEKVGQLMMVFYFGGFTSTESDEYKDLVESIEKRHVGGLVARTRSSRSTCSACRSNCACPKSSV